MGVREWLLLLLLSVLWGGSFFFFKVLVAELPTLTIVFARVLLAGVLLNLVMLARREAKIGRASCRERVCLAV